MGGGTGRLACRFAARGHDVTGAEPTAAMLEIAPHTLRFMSRENLDRLLSEAGFPSVRYYGDWDFSDWRETSPEIIAIAG